MKTIKIYLLLIITAFVLTLNAQNDKALLAELVAEEQDAVNALVLYPEDVRSSILEATLYPEALIKMENIQQMTSIAFAEVMENQPQSTQNMIWDLTRYPDLINRLVALDNHLTSKVEQILEDYPEVIRPRAREAFAREYSLLVKVNDLQLSAITAFESVITSYPVDVQQTLYQLTNMPEVLTILTDNIRLTILVGDLYQKDAEWLVYKMDSLSLVVARENARELEDWNESLDNNPQAKEELIAASKSYASEYDDEYYDDDEPEVRREVIVRYHYDYHYPYWLGYPVWYTYPRWRPYPHWYDWGFRPHHHTIVIIGMPSYHFMHWYFDHHHYHHHRHWSHLSAHFVHHYHGHRRHGGSITTSVNTWRRSNSAVVSKDWIKNDRQLANRFKEYGEMEGARATYNKQNPKKQLSKKDYIQQNASRYPSLKKSTDFTKVEVQKEVTKPSKVRKQKDKVVTKPQVNKRDKPVYKPQAPKVRKQKDKVITKPQVNKKDKPVYTPRPNKKKEPLRKQKEIKKPNNKPSPPKIKRGTDYHKKTWEKPRKDKKKITRPPNQKKVKKIKPPNK